MKLINATKGQFIQVDDSDYEWLSQWKWCVVTKKHTYYAVRRVGKSNQYMHRIIMNTPKGMEVDHIDFNGLNCQRNNMRNCLSWQNKVHKKPTGKSKYLGVSFRKSTNVFVGHIRIEGRVKYLGSSPSEIIVAMMYDEAAKKHHREFANLNFK